MISTEKAFDMLPYAVDIYEKLQIKDYIKKNKIKLNEIGNKEKDQLILDKGEDFIKYILKNSAKIKEEMFEIVAIVQEKSVDEIRKQNLIVTLNAFIAIFKDKELMDFFNQAMP